MSSNRNDNPDRNGYCWFVRNDILCRPWRNLHNASVLAALRHMEAVLS